MLRRCARVVTSLAILFLAAVPLAGVIVNTEGIHGDVLTASAAELHAHADQVYFDAAEVASALQVAGMGMGTTAMQTTTLEGVPICTDHNPTTWHPLVKRNTAGAITCTYGHEHHADPNSVNDIFGPPGAWAGVSGQAISYPWQTSSTAGLENQAKHQGYKWYVARNQPCRPAVTEASKDGCFISWRVQVHSLGTAADAIVRYHSFSLEAVIQHQGRQGIVRHGGWIDGGHLALNVNGGTGTNLCPPLTSNPSTFTCGQGVRREHSSANVPAPFTAHSTYLINWYANHNGSSVGPKLEEWGPIDYRNPGNQLFYPSDVRGNNSRGRIENMVVQLRYPWLSTSTDATGLVRFNGYTDRHGQPVSGCTTAAVDCVPFAVAGAPNKTYYFNAGIQGLVAMPEYDVSSPVTSKSLIRFPN